MSPGPESAPPTGAAPSDRPSPLAAYGPDALLQSDGFVLAIAADGTRLGRFVLLDREGEGAMGVVFSAYDETLDRKVAIKLIRDAGIAEDRLRIRREAQAMARLSHPNVAQIYEAGEVGGRLYMAMEFVPGDDLQAWQQATRRPWSETLAMYLQVGEGLAAAHAAGILHRDFKPHNVLIGADGRPRVIDFGLARAPGASGRPPVERDEDVRLDEPLTRVGTVVGTPAYMALEQFRGQPLDARTDQFAFCVSLYEALYGRAPYPRTELGPLLAALERHAVAPPGATDAPSWLFDVLKRGLHPDPDARWPSMTDLLAELSRDRETDPSTGRGPRLLFIGAVGLVVLANTIVGRLSHGWSPPTLEQMLLFALLVQGAALVALLVGRRAVLTSAFNRRITAFFFSAIGVVLVGRLLGWSRGGDPLGIFTAELIALTALSALAAATIARWFRWLAALLGLGTVAALIEPRAVVLAYSVAVPVACLLAFYFTIDRQAHRGTRRRSRPPEPR